MLKGRDMMIAVFFMDMFNGALARFEGRLGVVFGRRIGTSPQHTIPRRVWSFSLAAGGTIESFSMYEY